MTTAQTVFCGRQRAAQVTNDRGRAFRVRLIGDGEPYGLNGVLTNDYGDTLVEFYDATFAGQDAFGPLGQFVSRYTLSTLADRPLLPSGDVAGLLLDGGIPEWSLDGTAVDAALRWAQEEVGRLTPAGEPR